MSRTTNIANKPPLGKLIATRLKELGKTQRTLAREIGTSHTSINSIVSGRHRPSLDTLKCIADNLNLSVGELAGALLDGKQEGSEVGH